MDGRIFFSGNPWPNGHRIETLEFSILLDKSGPRLCLNMQSADYYAEDPANSDDDNNLIEDSWLSKLVWGNYHKCILSNTYWGIAPETAPHWPRDGNIINPDRLGSANFKIDPASIGDELQDNLDAYAFHTYLLGHDAVAGHDIQIGQQENSLFSLRWSGLIALAYGGDYVLRHEFQADAIDVAFDGFTILPPPPKNSIFGEKPPSLEDRERHARELAEQYVLNSTKLIFSADRSGQIDTLRLA